MAKEVEVSFDDDPVPSAAESFESATPVVPFVSASEPHRSGAGLTRILPHSLEAEEYLLSSCLIDGEDIMRRCEEAKLGPDSYYDTKHKIVYEILYDLYKAKLPIDIAVVAEELKKRRQLDQIGGYGFLVQISSRIPTTAQASYFIEKVREQAALRAVIRSATGLVEDCYSFTGDIDQFLSDAKKKFAEVDERTRPVERGHLRALFDFGLVPDSDRSVLLGKRYLNRGDIAVLSSTSGMGKSSMALQMATAFALGIAAFGENGIKPNGPLTSLIIQSEDSEGDVAEVAAGLSHGFQLDDAKRSLINRRVFVVTDRVNRGGKFIAALRRHIDTLKPDLVWINPLQAFMDGDITESRDCGQFLREGLNSLNEPAAHAYMLVHHTTKPAREVKGQPAAKWNEQMYEMAGGAEIINAARAIMILKAAETEGNFNLHLAKRGRRAGAVKRVAVQEGMSHRVEPVTVIPLRHASEWIDAGGGKIPAIFWEPRKEDVADPDRPDAATSGRGRKTVHVFAKWAKKFPGKSTAGLPFNQLHRELQQERPIAKSSLGDALDRWIEEGCVEAVDGGGVTRYRKAVVDPKPAAG